MGARCTTRRSSGTTHPQPELFQLFGEESGSSRPPNLGEPRGHRRGFCGTQWSRWPTSAPFVQILDDPVPQTGMENLLLEVFRLFDSQVPEQAIDVPKISQDRIQQRLVDRDLRHAQMAEQLLEMCEFVQFASLLQQQRAEQIIDIPVRSGALQGFRPGQVSTASFSISRPADEALKFFFSHFSQKEKSARVAGQVGAQLTVGTSAHPRWALIRRVLAGGGGGGPDRWIDEHGRTWWRSCAVLGRWWLARHQHGRGHLLGQARLGGGDGEDGRRGGRLQGLLPGRGAAAFCGADLL